MFLKDWCVIGNDRDVFAYKVTPVYIDTILPLLAFLWVVEVARSHTAVILKSGPRPTGTLLVITPMMIVSNVYFKVLEIVALVMR